MTEPIARIQALADQCVLCGLCLPHCPTYAVARVESESPRGRIMLAKGLAQGRLDPADAGNWHGIDHCLGCRRCESVCPAHVEFGELLVQARRLQRMHMKPPRRQRLLEWMVLRPHLLTSTFGALRAVRPLLPRLLQLRVPAVPSASEPREFHRAEGTSRGTVALFLGCVARRLDVPVHLAAIRVLTRLGWNVRVPAQQTCCGALHRHAGSEHAEHALQQQNHAAFASEDIDAVITSASGCFDSVRRGVPAGTAVHELLAFIAQDKNAGALDVMPRPAKIALHTPCTQASVVREADAARRVLTLIPQLEIMSLTGHGCCGAAGNHVLLQPERAATLRQPLLDHFAATDATGLCSANIGCRLHLQAGLGAVESLTVRHPIELLAEALR